MVSHRLGLTKAYPGSLPASLALIHAYLRIGRPERALDQCRELVEGRSSSEPRVHILRYKAAVRAIAVAIAREDFFFIWELGRSNDGARRLRRMLLAELAAVRVAGGVVLMDALLDGLSPDEGALRSFLKAKAEELRLLGDATSSALAR
jgi:hypothetical protein